MSGQPPYILTNPYSYSRDNRYAHGTNSDTAMAYHRRPTMLGNYSPYSNSDRASMHPYYLTIPPMPMGPHVDDATKASRYSTMNSPMVAMPVDIKKEQSLYQPATEAISPIHEDIKLDSHMRDTSVIRSTISKLNSDIDMTSEKLQRAQLSQSEIRRQADTTAVEDEEIDHDVQTDGSQTLIEKILHENRKIAEEGQKSFNQMNNNMDFSIPLYHQPSDLESMENIRTQYMIIMKNRLIKLFKRSRERYMQKTKFVSENYDQSYQEWQKIIEKEEKLILSKDVSTYRDTFEKTFPELRKAREDKEKKQSIQNSNETSSSSSISSTDSSSGQQISTNGGSNHYQEMQEDDEKMRKSSVVPPIIFDRWQRKHQYFNENGLIKDDPFLFYKEHAKLPYWSPEERQIFIEKFTQSPKIFGYISSFLENKTTEQCVQYYYMTKKAENYKNLLRKQAPSNRRRPKNPITTLTTTTVTSSTTIETTLVTKVSSNTIVSSTSQQILGTGRESERPSEGIDHDDERRDNNPNDFNEERRTNKNRCQFLSCTSSRKKNRKTRLRVFPTKWNELNDEQREEIRRILQIPPNVQRCCTRCYGNLIGEVCHRHNSQLLEEDDEDDEDEDENNEESVVSDRSNAKNGHDDWKPTDIDAFRKAFEKFNGDCGKIAELLGRSEQSCLAFSQSQQKVLFPDDVIDDDNASISDSEPSKAKSNRYEERNKLNLNEDSNDSTHPMIIDEGEEIQSVHEEFTENSNKNSLTATTSNLTTINSLVEKEITRTLHETERRLAINPVHSEVTNPIEKTSQTRPARISPLTVAPTPPALVIPVRSQSPTNQHYQYSMNPQLSSSSSSKGSIMRGTPISPSTAPHKPIPIDPTVPPAHLFSNSRNEPSTMKSPKTLDKNLEQQQIQLQQQQQLHRRRQQQQQQQQQPQQPQQSQHQQHQQQHQQQQQQQQAVYISQYSGAHNSSPIFIQPQTHQQHMLSSHKPDVNHANRLETLTTDFHTSKNLANPSVHPSSHERSHRSNVHDHRGVRLNSSPVNQHLAPQTTNPSVQSATHPHHSAGAGNFLASSQIFGQPGMYPQDVLTHHNLPYPSHYGTLPTSTQVLFDPRILQDYAAAAAAANSEQQKLVTRPGRLHHGHHSSVDPAAYSNHLSSRHIHEEMGYPNSEYLSSPWRTKNMNTNQLMKGGHGSNDNPMLKLADLSRHSTNRMPTGNERDSRSRSPDDPHPGHHRLDASRSSLEVPGVHFQRADGSGHHKIPHDKSNSHLHYMDHSNDPNALAYMRTSMHLSKHPSNHHSPHRSHPNLNTNSRPMIPAPVPSMTGNNAAAYMMHGFQHPNVGPVSPHRQHQQTPSHHLHHPSHYAPASSRNVNSFESNKSKDQISIQEYMKKSVDEFVRATNYDHKHPNQDSVHESSTRNHLANNSDQPILIDVEDDSNPIDRNETEGNLRSGQKSNAEMEMFGRPRVSSIKKILSNQTLEKQQYDDINQQVQNSSNNSNTPKLSNSDQSNIECLNNIGGRTKSRNSITMRMLMGENEAYVDGKAQRRSSPDEMSNKRPLSSDGNCEKIEYLIRDELIRSQPSITKEAPSVFSKPHINQQQYRQSSSSKRMKTMSNEDQRNPSNQSLRDSPGISRDPFTLQPQSKTAHPSHQSSSNAERHWQSLAQQQYHQQSPVLSSRSSRPTGSITQGSPISSSIRLSTDQSSYSMATNNHLINPRYPCYVNKNEQSHSFSRQSSASPHEHSPKHKVQRRSYQDNSPTLDFYPSSSGFSHIDQQTTGRSPSANPMPTHTPPSNTPAGSHSLKKRIMTEYELEKQRNSPNLNSSSSTTMASTRTDIVEQISSSLPENNSRNEVDVERIRDSHEEINSESNNNDSVKST